MIGTDNFVGLSESAAEATFDRMRLGMVEGTVPDHVGTWLLYCNSAEESPRFFYDRTATFQVLSAG